jgi:hypothetical protein
MPRRPGRSWGQAAATTRGAGITADPTPATSRWRRTKLTFPRPPVRPLIQQKGLGISVALMPQWRQDHPHRRPLARRKSRPRIRPRGPPPPRAGHRDRAATRPHPPCVLSVTRVDGKKRAEIAMYKAMLSINHDKKQEDKLRLLPVFSTECSDGLTPSSLSRCCNLFGRKRRR